MQWVEKAPPMLVPHIPQPGDPKPLPPQNSPQPAGPTPSTCQETADAKPISSESKPTIDVVPIVQLRALTRTRVSVSFRVQQAPWREPVRKT